MPTSCRALALAVGLALAAAALPALAAPIGSAPPEAVLPPELPWSGADRNLVLAPGDPWATPCEKSGFRRTPRYDETVEWLRKLVRAAPELEMVPIAESGEGRTVWMVVASAGRAFTPEALRRSGKPTVLVQAGIHAGEIDGKDAGMMLLRDLTVKGTARALLDRANLLFIPILNVDGHERFSRYGRINQRGPEEMGWRTNARNLNLNRDYSKLDTPGVRGVVGVLNRWDPDLYVDVHVTDGVDYQYDVTFGYVGPFGHSPNAAAWLDTYLTPAADKDLAALGHVPGPLVFALDNTDLGRGIVDWVPSPRFSDGYGDVRHTPTVLEENHSLKPYEQRVLGTYEFLESALRTVGAHGAELRRAIEADRDLRPETVTLAYKAPDTPPATRPFLGVRSRVSPSPVSGGLRVEWLGEPVTLDVPYIVQSEASVTVSRPKAYWIPAPYRDVIERMRRQGIRVDTQDAPRTLSVTEYRMTGAGIDPEPSEGRARAHGTPVAETHTETFPAGSARIPTDQPLGDLAVLLLEPGSQDSFYRWGFFLGMLERTEYVEGYVMEPMASQMLADDPRLARAFMDSLRTGPAFAGDPRARLRFFYDRTPYADSRYDLYPVAREE